MAEAFTTGVGRVGYQQIPQHSRTFANNSWEVISKCSDWMERNDLSTPEITETFGWNIGDNKGFVVEGINLSLRILGFMHDNKVGGGKAGISLELAPVAWGTQTSNPMHPTNTNLIGWHGCIMRTQNMPNILAQLPTDLQSVIKQVEKLTANGGTGTGDAFMQTSNDYLWLLSEREVWGQNPRSLAGEGTHYELYIINNAQAFRIKQQHNGTLIQWWTRSPNRSNATQFLTFTVSGNWNSLPANTTSPMAISFGLCV